MDGAYDLGKAYRLLKRMGIKPCQNAFTLRKNKAFILRKINLVVGSYPALQGWRGLGWEKLCKP
jgi:hypothetical protein